MTSPEDDWCDPPECRTSQPPPSFKDSGERRDFGTGAVRDACGGKGRMDLLPMRALMEVSRVYEEGAKKYGERNWEKGIPLHCYADSAMRHLAKCMIGMTDEPHLSMAAWNLLCMIETALRVREGILPDTLCDLPCPGVAFLTPEPEKEPA